MKVGFSGFVECLLQYHGTNIYSYTLGIEEAQINVFVKHNVQQRLLFEKTRKAPVICVALVNCKF